MPDIGAGRVSGSIVYIYIYMLETGRGRMHNRVRRGRNESPRSTTRNLGADRRDRKAAVDGRVDSATGDYGRRRVSHTVVHLFMYAFAISHRGLKSPGLMRKRKLAATRSIRRSGRRSFNVIQSYCASFRVHFAFYIGFHRRHHTRLNCRATVGGRSRPAHRTRCMFTRVDGGSHVMMFCLLHICLRK